MSISDEQCQELLKKKEDGHDVKSELLPASYFGNPHLLDQFVERFQLCEHGTHTNSSQSPVKPTDFFDSLAEQQRQLESLPTRPFRREEYIVPSQQK
jgi:HCNGP-like protein